jgi:hypothetical protein
MDKWIIRTQAFLKIPVTEGLQVFPDLLAKFFFYALTVLNIYICPELLAEKRERLP